MSPVDGLPAPWNDMRRYHAPMWRRLAPRHAPTLWSMRSRYLLRRLARIETHCREHGQRGDVAVRADWVAAILWDELARRDITERLTDWALGRLGRDPSVGPYQVTGATAAEVLAFLGEAELSRSNARSRLMDFDFATRIVIGRVAQILEHWRAAGFDPFVAGGLGPHAVSPIELAGTLYSQGLGEPKAAPRANGRGLQIARFASQLEESAAKKLAETDPRGCVAGRNNDDKPSEVLCHDGICDAAYADQLPKAK